MRIKSSILNHFILRFTVLGSQFMVYPVKQFVRIFCFSKSLTGSTASRDLDFLIKIQTSNSEFSEAWGISTGFSKAVQLLIKDKVAVPTGPLRCLPTIISANPFLGLSSRVL